jgi:hypothetical protein
MISDAEVDEFLAHYGVKGMRWGVHSTQAQARSDATEFVKAKMFYGEGAGTRRKLINAKVAERSKNPDYKKAFDQHVAAQNLAKRAAQATRSRRRKDVTGFVSKTGRGVYRQLTGGFGPVTATAATIAAGAAFAHRAGLDKKLMNKVKASMNNPAAKKAAKGSAEAWLRSQGYWR